MKKVWALLIAGAFLAGSFLLLPSVCPAQSKEDQEKQLRAELENIKKAEQQSEDEADKLVPKGMPRGAKRQPRLVSKDLIIEQLQKPPQQVGATPTQPGAPAAPQVALQPGQSPSVPTQSGAVIFTSEAVLFDYGSAQLRETAMPQLMIIAQALNDPQLANIPTFFVDGHTCDIGSDESNCWLSWERAKSVLTALMALGVPPQRVIPRGFGKRDPMYMNLNDAVRMFNRRVVLKSGTVVLPRDQMLLCQAWGGYGGGLPVPGMVPAMPGMVPTVPGMVPPPVPGTTPAPSSSTEVQSPPGMGGPDYTQMPFTETTRQKKVIKGFKETVVPGTTPAPQSPAATPSQQRDAPRGFKKTPAQQ